VAGIGKENSIGYAIAKRLSEGGYSVIGLDIYHPVKDINFLYDFMICDVTDEESVRTVFRVINYADLIVNCVGINRMSPLEHCSLGDWNATIRANLTSNFLLLREWVRNHRHGAQKTFIAITSDTGYIPKSNSCAYASSKAGANMFIQATARELNKKYGEEWIVTALALGRVEGTPMDVGTIDDMTRVLGVSREEANAMLNKNIPLGRGTSPAEVAEWVAFLAEHGQFASGNVLRIDGGQLQG
jgi:NAD(P)-dependent dehydrogenase (short-subunit alcohol dehydrogenase family)